MRQNNSQAWFAQKSQDRATTSAQWVKLGHVRVKPARLANHCFIRSCYVMMGNALAYEKTVPAELNICRCGAITVHIPLRECSQ